MVKQILQIENAQSSDFIPKLLKGFKDILEDTNKSSDEGEVILTREQTAEMLSISLVSLWKFTKEGIIPAYRIGTRVRYKKSEILLALKKMNQF